MRHLRDNSLQWRMFTLLMFDKIDYYSKNTIFDILNKNT
jgi:hypothetical protein